MKKKKNRQPSASKADNTETGGGTEDWNETTPTDEKEKPRNKIGGPGRLHGRHNDSRGWRGRERQENERNLEDGGRSEFRDRRGRSGGAPRGGGGRGRGGGRAGGRFPPRGNRSNYSNNKPIDTWDSNTWDNSTAATANHVEENWDDLHTEEWSAEEYTGSLAETKVFTPSVPPEPIKEAINEPKPGMTAPNIVESVTIVPSGQQAQMATQNPAAIHGTLNAAQTQYFNQLTQQSSENMKVGGQYAGQPQTYTQQQGYSNAANAQTGSQQYSNTQPQYGNAPSNTYVNNSYPQTYGSVPEQTPVQQPVRTKTQRARVPPPSKVSEDMKFNILF